MTVQPAPEPTKEEIILYAAPEGGLQVPYAFLHDLLKVRWADNPKRHQGELVQQSVQAYGFNDPPELDITHGILVAGHGRLEMLEAEQKAVLASVAGAKIPKNIFNIPYPGGPGGRDWLIPVIPLEFETKEDAFRYALASNRAGVMRLAPEDYDGIKLSRALKAALAGAGEQTALPGFSGEDMMLGGSVGARTELVLPQLPAFDLQRPFDPGSLDGMIAYQSGQAPQSYLAMIAFPSLDMLREAVRVLTLGKRTGLPDDTTKASIEGSVLLPTWKARILGETADLAAQVNPATVGALPGQMTMAGDVVGTKPAALRLVPETLLPGQEVGRILHISQASEPGPEPLPPLVPIPAAVIPGLPRAPFQSAHSVEFREMMAQEPFEHGAPGSAAWASQANLPAPEGSAGAFDEVADFDPASAGGLDDAMESWTPQNAGGLSAEETAMFAALAESVFPAAPAPTGGPAAVVAAQPTPMPSVAPNGPLQAAPVPLRSNAVPVSGPSVVIKPKYSDLVVPAVPSIQELPRQETLLNGFEAPGPEKKSRKKAAPLQALPMDAALDAAKASDLQATVAAKGLQEPKWIGGLCAGACGGSGFLGYTGPKEARVKNPCPDCEGAGDREAWLKAKGLA